MDDDVGLFIGRLVVPEGTKYSHEKNCLRFGTSVGLAMKSQ